MLSFSPLGILVAPSISNGMEPDTAVQAGAATPDDAVRMFLLAMFTKNETALREVAIPTAEFQILLEGESVPADKQDQMKALIAQMPIRALKSGDEFTLPGNRKMTVGRAEVSPDRAVMLPEGWDIPFRVQKVASQWRVDARPIIEGRKAGKAALEKAHRK